MCGIAGFALNSNSDHINCREVILRMSNSLHHRGPDDGGIWIDLQHRLALGHRRLSILDTSRAGCQPIESASGRFIMVFNGEIYNYKYLREQINLSASYPWRSHSDTEVVIACLETWGIDKTIRCLSGMYAIAILDRRLDSLTLVRDPIGEKPLYYGWQSGCFIFASELKAIKLHPAFKPNINDKIFPLYMRSGYIPTPFTVWKDIYKLPPGSFIKVALSSPATHIQPEFYWHLNTNVICDSSSTKSSKADEYINLLEESLVASVLRQSVADVPVGTFLSGGIDSSLITAIAQKHSSNRINTFSIGFENPLYDESSYARSIARYLGTDHHEYIVTPSEVLDLVHKLSTVYDEPFGDSSAIPTYFVSKLARNYVKVCLSGDGADELFGGYARYLKTYSIWKKLSIVPCFVRQAASALLQSQPVQLSLSQLHNAYAFRNTRYLTRLVTRLRLMFPLISSDSCITLYRHLMSQWPTPHDLPCIDETFSEISLLSANQQALTGISELMYYDTLSYLLDDILVKVDRASMSVGLEVRAPFLDKEVIKCAWNSPEELRINHSIPKYALRTILDKYIPSHLYDRPKQGFAVPLEDWLRGPLKEWASELLLSPSLADDGYWNTANVRERWNELLSGNNNWRDSLWLVLMWQSWIHSH